MAARLQRSMVEGMDRQGSGPQMGAGPNLAPRLFKMMGDEELQTRLLPQIQKTLKIKSGGSDDLTAIFDLILRDKDKESRVRKILDREMPEEREVERGRRRAQSDAGAFRQNADQYQLGLSVEAMCDGLETNPYLLQWLEAFLHASGRKFKVHGNLLERVEVVKRAFQTANGRWDGALIESAKIRIVVASGQAQVHQGCLLICGEKGKSRRITAAEALAFCLKGEVTPHFGSHTIEQHRALLELMVRDLSRHPMRAKTLEPHVCGVADHLKVCLLGEGDFAAFALPYMNLAEAGPLGDLGYYRSALVIDTSSETPPSLSEAIRSTAIIIDASHEVKGLSITSPAQKKHAAFQDSLMQVDCNTLYFKGSTAQLGLYPDLIRKVSHLWVEIDEITADLLKLLQTLPRCTTLHISTSIKTEGPFLEYKLLAKLIEKAPKLQHLTLSGATFILASARTKDTWTANLRSLNVSVSLQEKLKGSAAKGVLQFTANSRAIPDLNLNIRYPSALMEIMEMPPNIESGTKTAAVRKQAFDQQIEIEGTDYREALLKEREALQLLLQQLGAGEQRRPFIGLYVPTWPEACNRLLPPLATEIKLRVDRVNPDSNPRPIKWPDDVGELHYRGPFCGTFSDWFGTTDAFVDQGIPVLSFTHGKMTTEKLIQLEAELNEMEGVKELNLSCNDLDGAALPVIKKLIKNTRLLRLDLRKNPLDQIRVEPSAKKPTAASDVPPPLPKDRPSLRATILPGSTTSVYYSDPVGTYAENYYGDSAYETLTTPNGATMQPSSLQGLYDVDINTTASANLCYTTKPQAPEEGLYDVDIDTTASTSLDSTTKPPSSEDNTYLTLAAVRAEAEAAQNLHYAPLKEFQESRGKDVRSVPGFQAHLKKASFAKSRVEEERTFQIDEEDPPPPPARLSLTARAAQEPEDTAYEAPQELGLSLLLQEIAECDYLVYLDISECGWNPAMLKALPRLQHLRELGIGNATCGEKDVEAMLAALEKTNIRHLHVPVEGALKEKISEWNLRRAQEDPILNQSEA